jgi:hypothetical protein
MRGAGYVRFELGAVAGELRDGWTVLCGLEYWFVNRFFGMDEG